MLLQPTQLVLKQTCSSVNIFHATLKKKFMVLVSILELTYAWALYFFKYVMREYSSFKHHCSETHGQQLVPLLTVCCLKVQDGAGAPSRVGRNQ